MANLARDQSHCRQKRHGAGSRLQCHPRGTLSPPARCITSTDILQFQRIFILGPGNGSIHRDSIELGASLTGIQFDFIEGHAPPNTTSETFREKAIEDAQMTALRTSVRPCASLVHSTDSTGRIQQQNISSALILEEAADWDIRLKSQLQDFARASQMLLQPIRGTSNRFLDPFWPRKTEHDQPVDIFFSGPTAAIQAPTSSSYGDLDRWDVLWLGHHGSRFPDPADTGLPLGRVVITHDPTSLQMQHFDRGMLGTRDFEHFYGNATRVVSHARGTDYALAYAVSRHGARALLRDLAARPSDLSLSAGLARSCDGEGGTARRTCLTVVPPLFAQHDADRTPPVTRNVRWSTRLNLEALVAGNATEYADQWPDWTGEEEDL